MPAPAVAVGVVALLAASLPFASASAETRGYALAGDRSSAYPTDGTILHPGAVTGSMVLSDDGAGTVTLDDFVLRSQFTDSLVCVDCGGIPGTTYTFSQDTTVQIAPGQEGDGSIRGTLDWGVLTGFTQTGVSVCRTRCPGGCGPSSHCVFTVGFEGTGRPVPLKSDAFLTDPWSFDGFGTFLSIGRRCAGGSAVGSTEPDPTDPNDPAVCTQDSDCPGTCSTGPGEPSFPCPCTDTIELLFLEPAPGLILRGHARFLGNPVPAVPILGFAALGAALLYLGVRAAQRRSR